MAKKQSTSNKKKLHRHCIHCSVVKDRFFTNKGEPIMGRCVFSEYMFLLNEKTDCEDIKIE